MRGFIELVAAAVLGSAVGSLIGLSVGVGRRHDAPQSSTPRSCLTVTVWLGDMDFDNLLAPPDLAEAMQVIRSHHPEIPVVVTVCE
jgi:hypothetical protein